MIRIMLGTTLVGTTVVPNLLQDQASPLLSHDLPARFELMLTALGAALILVVCALIITAMIMVVWSAVRHATGEVVRVAITLYSHRRIG